MKLSQRKYERPNITKDIKELEKIIEVIENSEDKDLVFENIKKYYEKIRHINTMYSLCYFRHTINTNDEFYKNENDFFDEVMPLLDEIEAKASAARLNSKCRKDIEKAFGTYILEQDELRKKTFSKQILEDLVEENKLTSEYDKLTASALIDFEGEKRTLSMLLPFQKSKDRAMRKKANDAYFNWFKENSQKLDEIYDKLVKVRHKIAKKLGFDNFIEVAYARMGRTDWNAEDAKKYRKQILDVVVPYTQKYYKEQAKRIGIENPKNYDYKLMYLSGNAKPIGEEKVLVESAKKMYSEMSKETKEFFDMMIEDELMDLTSKIGKVGGGYCTTLPEFKVPVIFSNFNGTSADVDVLTHEAGHAFQAYCSKDIYPDIYQDVKSDTAEIHSMSMEFFAHPWMGLFFGDDNDKYYHSHVVESINFLPYGATVDEFQEWVYENPEATPKQRNEAFRTIEKKYSPHLDYDGFEYLENGGFWQKQSHIYEVPFYYLDYTLAQVCAFQFFLKDIKNHEDAWNAYIKLCNLAAKEPFTKIVKQVGLENPFEGKIMENIIPKLDEYLQRLDYSKIK